MKNKVGTMKNSVSSDELGGKFVQRLAFFSTGSSPMDTSHQTFSMINFLKKLFIKPTNQQPQHKLLSSSDIRRLLIEGNFIDPDGVEVDLNDQITQVGIYSSNMYSPWLNPLNLCVFHVFAIFQTKSTDLQSSWWWSIDKNTSCLVIQRSRTLEPLFQGQNYPTLLHPKKGSKLVSPSKNRYLKEVFSELYKSGQLENKYHLWYANCQHFATHILETITGDKSWKGPMENAGVKKEKSNFEEVTNLGRQGEIEIISNPNSEYLTVVSTRPRPNSKHPNIERISAIMLFRHRNGYTPLVQSIFEGWELKYIKEILEDPNYCPVEEELPLHAAAQDGRDDVVQYLLEKRHLWTYLELLDVLQTVEYGNLTPLYQAVMPGLSSLETIKSLATEGNVNIADQDEKMGPLHWAARNRAPLKIECLVKIKSIDKNAQDRRGYTPLHWITEKFQPERCFESVIKDLKTEENVMLQDNNGMTPLHRAVMSQHYYIVEHVVTEKNVNVQDNAGNTPLHLAVFFDCYSDIFERLLSEESININIVDYEGQSSLHSAVKNGKLDTTKFLLKNKIFLEKVDINLQDREGRTALHLALLTKGMEDVVEDLLSVKGIDPNIVDSRGRTALNIAIEKRLEDPSSNGYYTMLKLLLKHGGVSFTTSNETLIETSQIDPNVENGTKTSNEETIRESKKEISIKKGLPYFSLVISFFVIIICIFVLTCLN